MKKLSILTLGLAAIALIGCSGPKTVTTYDQSPKKDPNGNIRVVHLAIKNTVPVSYSYTTNEESCSEVEFLKHVTGVDKHGNRIDNVYEIHWNIVESTNSDALGHVSSKRHLCSFWGVGIEYGEPVVINE